MSTNPFSPPQQAGEVAGYRPLGLLTGIVITALALDAILLVSNTASTLALTAHDPGMLTSGEPKDGVSALLAVLAFLGAVIYLLSYVVGIVGFLLWLSRANRNAHVLGAENMEFTPGWVVGWFFVPIFNLFKPYEAVDELYLASAPDGGPDDWGASEAPRFILLWWLSWIGFGITSGVAGASGGTSSWRLVALVVGCVASGLAIAVVLSIHRRQREKLACGAAVTEGLQGPRHRFL